MKRDDRIRQCIDQNLSGLRVSRQWQSDMIDTITEGRKPMKKKIPFGIALAAILMLASMTALAAGINLFEYFSAQDARYGKLAEQASQVTAAPLAVESDTLGKVNARIDSAYYDGQSLAVGLMIENAHRIEAYTPDPLELTNDRITVDPIYMPARNEEEARILAEYEAAVERGTPYGYVIYNVYYSDHIYANGVDLPPYGGREEADDQGVFRAIRDYDLLDDEYDSPLETLIGQDKLDLSVRLRESRGVFYFDGEESFHYIDVRDIGDVTATVYRTDGQTATYSGSATIEGVTFTAEVKLSAMEGKVSVRASDPDFFNLVDTEYGKDLPWHMAAFDENGAEYEIHSFRIAETNPLESRMIGSGELPKELHLYLLHSDAQVDVFDYWPDVALKTENPHLILTR